jgi:predicted Zn-dependent protease
MIRNRRTIGTLLFAMVLAAGLAGGSSGCASGTGFNIFPESRDIELGRQVDGEIRKNPNEYPILQGHPDIKLFVEGVGRKILASPHVEKKDIFAYQFEVIHDDSTINAFCTPGGYIYVYTGLLRFLDNEASFAGVIGHEIAHAERRHATRRMSSALGVQILISIVLGERPSQAAQIAGNLFGGLALLKNSRDDETESDTYSIRYLQSTEYYPGAIRYFFEKVSRGGKGSAFERLLSTHPLPQDRIENVDRLMKEYNIPEPTEASLFSARYQEMKTKLPTSR